MDKKIKTQRKQWQKPELIVLVRSKPEEAVLLACKDPSSPIHSNQFKNYYCAVISGCDGRCQTYGPS